MSASSKVQISEAARRYASALFELARDANELADADNGLKAVSAALNESADLRKMLSSPLYPAEEKAAVFKALSEKLGLPDLVARFLGVTAMNRRAYDIPGVIRAFSELYAKQRGTLRAVARTAYPLTDSQLGQLKDLVSKAVGGDADLEVEVNPDLVGGLQLQIGSRLIDASLRTKLDGLNAAMKGA